MRFFGRKHKQVKLPSMNGFIDRHSHILPGVDDGVPTMEETLTILDAYCEMGVREVWLTPHIMEDIPNTVDMLKNRFEKLLENYSGTVTLRLGSENMIDMLLLERLEEKNLLPVGDEEDMLLVETSFFSAPVNMSETLEKVMATGLTPLLAHPERYAYMSSDDYARLADKGVKFQVNLLSPAGSYGKDAAEKSRYLIENYDVVFGSDIHSAKMLKDLEKLN